MRIGPGTAIGCAGFGYENRDGHYQLLDHGGRVLIEDDVDIGANCTIARAKTGRETRIGRVREDRLPCAHRPQRGDWVRLHSRGSGRGLRAVPLSATA